MDAIKTQRLLFRLFVHSVWRRIAALSLLCPWLRQCSADLVACIAAMTGGGGAYDHCIHFAASHSIIFCLYQA